MIRRKLAALALLPLASGAAPAPDHGEPYRILRDANLTLDAELAASAYASNARLIFDYPGQPKERFEGQADIRSSYVRTFGQIDPGSPIRLEFRFEPPGLSADRQVGAYRIDAHAGGRPITLYGRFAVRLVRENGHWRFAEDLGSPAAASDFDRLPAASLDPSPAEENGGRGKD